VTPRNMLSPHIKEKLIWDLKYLPHISPLLPTLIKKITLVK
jgi:hypothetical protein